MGDAENDAQRIARLQQELSETRSWSKALSDRWTLLDKVLPVGLLITNDSGIIQAANPRALELFACDHSSLSGKEVISLVLIPSQDWFKNIAVAGEGTLSEVTALKVNGDQFPADIAFRSFVHEQTTNWLVVIEDVTRQQEIEQMKREFVSMLSHDLRAPLTSIQVFLDAVANGMYDKDQSQLKDMAGEIEEEAVRLVEMLNHLLEFDKAEAGKLRLVIGEFKCADIIQRSIRSVKQLAEQKQVSIKVLVADQAPFVLADADHIIRIIVNFLSNAIKFSPHGGAVVVEAVVQEACVKIEVTDQGPGIAAEFHKRIFSKFEQACISDARVKGGSGLGLAVAKAIVDQHGGTIGVDSEEGKGSTFWFTLPSLLDAPDQPD